MAGSGTGIPIWFSCPKERREAGTARLMRESVDAVRRRHVVTLTGSTKAAKFSRGHHPRMSFTSFGYTCSCGHMGWSAHRDLERLAVKTGDVPWETIEAYIPEYPAVYREQFRRSYRLPE
jgi:hypothetical protein